MNGNVPSLHIFPSCNPKTEVYSDARLQANGHWLAIHNMFVCMHAILWCPPFAIASYAPLCCSLLSDTVIGSIAGISLSILILFCCVCSFFVCCLCFIVYKWKKRRRGVSHLHRGSQIRPMQETAENEPSAPPLPLHSVPYAVQSTNPPSYNPEYFQPRYTQYSIDSALDQDSITENEFPPPYPG